MITVLSPAKKLSKDCFARTNNHHTPRFIDRSKILVSRLKELEIEELMKLMGISEKLAVLNIERMEKWNEAMNEDSSVEALYSFQGDTYTGLDAQTLQPDDIDFAQENTRILSGLYGVLRPLDLMMPYRLEMGTRLDNKYGKTLYEFWDDALAKSINKELQKHERNVVVNCASIEYFKSIDHPTLNAKVVTPHFKEIRDGKVKMISFYAKKARGMMARYIIKNRITDDEDILSFDLGGYNYDSSLSTPLDPVFTRAQA